MPLTPVEINKKNMPVYDTVNINESQLTSDRTKKNSGKLPSLTQAARRFTNVKEHVHNNRNFKNAVHCINAQHRDPLRQFNNEEKQEFARINVGGEGTNPL